MEEDRGIAIQHLNRALQAEAKIRELEGIIRGYETTIEEIMHTIGQYFSGHFIQKVYEDMYKSEPGECPENTCGDNGVDTQPSA